MYRQTRLLLHSEDLLRECTDGRTAREHICRFTDVQAPCAQLYRWMWSSRRVAQAEALPAATLWFSCHTDALLMQLVLQTDALPARVQFEVCRRAIVQSYVQTDALLGQLVVQTDALLVQLVLQTDALLMQLFLQTDALLVQLVLQRDALLMQLVLQTDALLM
jgi:hypothetical protein